MTEKNYKFIAEFLDKNKISNTSIVSSTNLYKEILELVDNDKDSIMFSNITSFSNRNSPNRVRIRNDKFLKDCKNNKKVVLISGIKINNKNLYLIFISSYFFNYNSSINSSNSFINFDFDDLHSFIYNNEDTIIIRKPKNKSTDHRYHNYAFYTTNDTNFDKNKFEKFFKNIEEITSNNSKSFEYTGHEYFVPQIPIKMRKKINTIYGRKCALCLLEKDDPLYCPCGDQINIEYLKKNDLSYIHLHHLIPKKYFLNDPSIDINWDLIHNINNIVPLCQPCHQAIHKGFKNKGLVHDIFNAIIKIFKKNNRYKKFEKHILNKTNFKNIDDLLDFYKS